MTPEYCVACALPEPEPGFGFSLPVSNGEVVANDFLGEWGCSSACRGCYEVHEAGGPQALAAHVRATKALRVQVLAYDAALDHAARRIEDTLNQIRRGRTR